jgi:endo-1,4-beta-xylanase
VLATTLPLPAASAAQEPDNGANGALDNAFMADLNGDGVLTEDEVRPGVFSLLDANRDGRADPGEVRAFLARGREPFSWVNPPGEDRRTPGVTHATFTSPSMGIPVGYNIYLPPGYDDAANRHARYPVIYYLHGGRPGNESRTVGIAEHVHAAIASGAVRPVIFVWGNGGQVSWYDHEDSRGEEVFVRELIPHIDDTYRTLAHRGGRALQGFSQGGRGTTRIMFKYPDLFVSAAPGGPGYAVERLVFENDGVERDPRAGDNARSFDFGKGNDAYSLARSYAEDGMQPALNVMIWVGTRGFNYEATLEYMGYLYGLGVPAERLIAPGVDHNPVWFYEAHGLDLLRFHDRYWRESGPDGR